MPHGISRSTNPALKQQLLAPKTRRRSNQVWWSKRHQAKKSPQQRAKKDRQRQKRLEKTPAAVTEMAKQLGAA